jgi:hypothetical protein
MNQGTTGVSASNSSARRRGPRGAQLEEVVEAADALLARGLKPIIERVRQHLGGGSPNTISPLLDVWYERLSARVAGVAVPAEDGLPPNLRSAWNHAKHEARTFANQELQEERKALEQGRALLSADQAELARREEHWAATNASIEKALTETREASEGCWLHRSRRWSPPIWFNYARPASAGRSHLRKCSRSCACPPLCSHMRTGVSKCHASASGTPASTSKTIATSCSYWAGPTTSRPMRA